MANNKNGEKFASATPLLIVLICFALFYFLIKPFVNDVKNLNINMSARNNEITAMQQKINDLNFLKQKFNESSPDVKLLTVALPDNADMADLMIQIRTMASNSSINLDLFQPFSGQQTTSQQSSSQSTNDASTANATSTSGTLNGVGITIDVNGNYENVLMFVENLEKNCRLISINSIDISSSQSTSSGTQTLTGNVSAKINANALIVATANSTSAPTASAAPTSQP